MSVASRKGGRNRCTVCESPNRQAIDAALTAGGMSLAKISAQFGGDPSADAIKRHRKSGHVRADLVNVTPLPEITQGDAIDLPTQYRDQFRRTLAAVEAAQKSASHLAISQALREHRMTLDSIAKWNLEQARIAAMNRPAATVRLTETEEYVGLKLVEEAVLWHPPYAVVQRALLLVYQAFAADPRSLEEWLRAYPSDGARRAWALPYIKKAEDDDARLNRAVFRVST